ncbi:MAG: UvrD-helicase domain-containing protein [Candidatus Fermentibacterota bacterium]
MADRTPPSDQSHRDTVRTHPGSLSVEASAGTGKTTLIVERVVEMVLRGADLGSIAVVTFTRAAAAELRDRIRRALLTAREEGADVEAALRQLPLAQISTIHSFAGSILREHCHRTGVDPDFTSGASRLPERETALEWDRYLTSLDGGLLRSCGDLLATAGTDTLLELALEIEKRPWITDLSPFTGEEDVLTAFRREMKPHLDVVERAGERCVDPSDKLMGSLQAMKRALAQLPASVAEVNDMDPAVLLFELGRVNRGGRKGSWDPPDFKDELKEVLTELKDRLSKLVPMLLGEKLMPQVEKLIMPFVALLRQRWREDISRFSYDDLLRLAAEALEDSPALARQVSDRFSHVLIDEFQDTSRMQVRFFRALMGGTDGRLPASRITLMGDPKQSIYGWRNADIETYRAAVKELSESGGLSERIEVNFRSTRSIIGFVEAFGAALFAQAHPAESPFGCDYAPLAPRPEAPEGVPVEVVGFDRRGLRSMNVSEMVDLQAEWLAREVERDGHPGRWALLLRGAGRADRFVAALERHGIPYAVEAGRDFKERPEVTDLLELLRTLTSPEDTMALAHTLRSPLFGVDDSDLTDAILAGMRGLGEVPENCPSSVSLAVEHLRGLSDAARRLPVADLFDLVLRSTPLLGVIAASGYQVERRLGNIQYVAELLVEGQVASVGELMDLLGRGEAGAEIEEPAFSPGASGAVTICTIHRAKGLSFPHVVLADLPTRTPNPGSKKMLLSYDHGGLAAFSLGRRAHRARSAHWYDIVDLERARGAAETRRLLYVALTRAESRLTVLTNRVKVDREKLLPAEKMFSAALEEVEAAAPDTFRWREMDLDMETTPSPSPLRPEEAAEEPPAEYFPFPQLKPSGEPSTPERELGVAVHKLLERMDPTDPQGWLEEHQVFLKAVAGGQMKRASELALAFFEMELPFDLESCEVVGREYPLVVSGEGRPQERYIDLLLDDGEGLIVVDYKTDHVPEPERESLDRLAEHYRGQQEGYLDAIGRAFGRPARGYLVFLAAGAVRGVGD